MLRFIKIIYFLYVLPGEGNDTYNTSVAHRSIARNLNAHSLLFPRALLGTNKQQSIQRLNLLVMTLLNKHEKYFLFHAPNRLSVFSYCISRNENRRLVVTCV
jgi:hypothetical protein